MYKKSIHFREYIIFTKIGPSPSAAHKREVKKAKSIENVPKFINICFFIGKETL